MDKEYFKKYYQEHRAEKLEYQKKYGRENYGDIRREYVRVYRSQWHAQLKQTVLDHYGKVCQVCGEPNSKKLCIDHIEENGKQHRKDLGLKAEGFNSQFYSWLIKNNFPEGYQALCNRCNLRKSYYHRNGLTGSADSSYTNRAS